VVYRQLLHLCFGASFSPSPLSMLRCVSCRQTPYVLFVGFCWRIVGASSLAVGISFGLQPGLQLKRACSPRGELVVFVGWMGGSA
jgi:hypothetical protein